MYTYTLKCTISTSQQDGTNYKPDDNRGTPGTQLQVQK